MKSTINAIIDDESNGTSALGLAALDQPPVQPVQPVEQYNNEDWIAFTSGVALALMMIWFIRSNLLQDMPIVIDEHGDIVRGGSGRPLMTQSQVLSRLPEVTYICTKSQGDKQRSDNKNVMKDSSHMDASRWSCCVCLENFESEETLRLLPRCGHAFHEECIVPWLTKRTSTCPVCKVAVMPEESDIKEQISCPKQKRIENRIQKILNLGSAITSSMRGAWFTLTVGNSRKSTTHNSPNVCESNEDAIALFNNLNQEPMQDPPLVEDDTCTYTSPLIKHQDDKSKGGDVV